MFVQSAFDFLLLTTREGSGWQAVDVIRTGYRFQRYWQRKFVLLVHESVHKTYELPLLHSTICMQITFLFSSRDLCFFFLTGVMDADQFRKHVNAAMLTI